jgi:hypothetical protein
MEAQSAASLIRNTRHGRSWGGDPYGLIICRGGGDLAIWDNRVPPVTADALKELDKFFPTDSADST